ncbi:MAG: hypothetical protein HXY34_07150 [Candidatus Thorarchaeota archaeon]|nr:hypothetical protein [Candidatus Thorarchaeota archaeon]
MSDTDAGDAHVTGDDTEMMDVGSLFRGTATVTFVVEVITAIMMLGSLVAYMVSRSGVVQIIDMDLAVILLLVGAIVTMFFFLATIGFFVRVNRRISRAVIWEGVRSLDLRKPRVKTVVLIYCFAVGLILVIGMWSYYLLWKNVLAPVAATSLSWFGFSISLGGFVLALLVQLVVAAVGRTASSVIRVVLAESS